MKISTTKASYFSPGKNEGGPAQNKVSKASLIVVITIIINSHPEKNKSSSTLPPSLASHCKIYSEADRRLKSCRQLYDDTFNIRKSPIRKNPDNQYIFNNDQNHHNHILDDQNLVRQEENGTRVVPHGG